MSSLDDSKDQFRTVIANHWAAIKSGSAEEADTHSKAADALVEQWKASGYLHDVLVALLDDPETPEVQCASATYLLHSGFPDDALPKLRAIADDDEIGLVASDAELELMNWSKQSG